VKRLTVTLLLLFAVPYAQAKCAAEAYSFSGSVTRTAEGAVISNAEITLTWSDPPSAQPQTVSAQTDAAGKYSIRLMFYPWSGTIAGADQCRAKLSSVSVHISAPGFVSQAIALTVSSVATTANYSLKRTAAE
jgi:hypothetical protein